MIKFNELSNEAAEKILNSEVSLPLKDFLESALPISTERVN